MTTNEYTQWQKSYAGTNNRLPIELLEHEIQHYSATQTTIEYKRHEPLRGLEPPQNFPAFLPALK